ncbi:hypothetical protein CYY_005326 [Polysphondylium violaceum]|uniref:Saposin B-type domain-containing protein n=1 Tax=Polysphondylium violaceum TaxID=133409 RepID=A0A8J4PTY8_9MYCE|nr:hypothetical protein CYY_005326 [Polysphondylium violaceum]
MLKSLLVVILFLAVFGNAARVPPKEGEITTACEICELGVRFIIEVAQKNSSVTYVTEELQHLCYIIPRGLQEACQQVISQYTPDLIQLIITSDNPEEVCSNQLPICSSSSASDSSYYAEENVGDDVTPCKICIYILNDALNIINNGGFISEHLTLALNVDCFKYMPTSADTSTCRSIVNTNMNELLQYNKNGLSSQAACAKCQYC